MYVPLSKLFNDRSFQLSAELLRKEEKSIGSTLWYNGNIIYQWARNKFPGINLQESLRTLSLRRSGQEVEVIYRPDELYFCIWVRHQDNKVAQRTWTIDAEIFEKEGTLRFGIKVSYTTPKDSSEDRHIFSIPHFVQSIINQNGLRDVLSLHAGVHVARDKDSLQELYSLIVSENRMCPVVVVTPRINGVEEGDGEYYLDASLFSKKVDYFSHVFCISASAMPIWRDMLSDEAGVFDGGVRTYYRGFDFSNFQYEKAPLTIARKVVASYFMDEEGCEHVGKEAFLQILIDRIREWDCRERIDWLGIGHRFYFAKQRELTRNQFQDNDVDNKDVQKIIQSYKKQLHDVQESFEQKSQDETTALDLAEEYERKWNDCKKTIFNQNQQIEMLLNILKERGQEYNYEIPDTYMDLPAWIDRNFSGRVCIVNKAVRALKNAQFDDVALVYKCVILLGDIYYKMKEGIIEPELFYKECDALCVEETRTISDSRAGEQGDTYFVDYHGCKRKMERHIKNKTLTRDPKRCMRIYFFWDNDDEVVVLCSLPGHLDIRST